MNYVTFGILVLTGFTACAEFGSYAFVHPTLRNLPPKYHIQVERGLLRTFGRVMPVLMTLCVIAPIGYALHHSGTSEPVRLTRWIAAACFVAALTSTAIFNVPINLATGKWDPEKSTSELEGNSKQMGNLPGRSIVVPALGVFIYLRGSLTRRLRMLNRTLTRSACLQNE